MRIQTKTYLMFLLKNKKLTHLSGARNSSIQAVKNSRTSLTTRDLTLTMNLNGVKLSKYSKTNKIILMAIATV